MTFLRHQFPAPAQDPKVSGTDSGASPLSVSTSGVVDGDLCVFAATTRDVTPDVNGPEGGGWTEIYSVAMSTDDIATAWFKFADGAEPSTWEWTHGGGTRIAAAMGIWRGPTELSEFAITFPYPPAGLTESTYAYPGSLWLGFYHLGLTSGSPTVTYPTPQIRSEADSQICDIFALPLGHGRSAPSLQVQADTLPTVSAGAMAVFA